MGMSIDEAMENIHAIQNYYNDEMQDGYIGFAKEDNESVDLAIATMRKYQMMQADYESRLKADMAAMLEDLKKEMNPIKDCEYQIYGKEHWNFVGKCQDVIQQKINALKGE